MITIVVVTFVAAIVTGAFGYGFSSIAVPVALLVVASRVLNPAFVVVEVVMNVCVLWMNRDVVGSIWRRAALVVTGLPPGIALGTAALDSVDPGWLKLAAFAALLPLILLQAAGYRRPFRRDITARIGLGAGVGLLYAITTISGPPLAAFLTNQGMAKREFRAALALIRFAASTLTSAVYSATGLFTAESLTMLAIMAPGIVVGIPIGTVIVRHVHEETFRRLCMSLDAAIIAFGLSTLLGALGLVHGSAAYLPFVAVLVLDVLLTVRYFRNGARRVPRPQLETP